MKVQAFLHRHYSPQVGESPAVHAGVIVIGATMVVMGIGLAATMVFLPVGTVIGLLGLFILLEGVFAHVGRPMKVRDALEAVVGLTGAAIALTFALAIVFFLVAFGAGTFAGIVDWLRRVI